VPLGAVRPDRLPHLGRQPPREGRAGPHEQEQQNALVLVVRAPLADAQRVGDAVREAALQHAVDLGGAEAHAAGVEDAVGAAQEGDLPRARVHADEVAVRPDAAEAREVGGAVAPAGPGSRAGGGVRRLVAPEEGGRVGEGGGADELARRAGGDLAPGRAAGLEGVEDADVDAEGRPLRAADVDGLKGVEAAEAAGLERGRVCVSVGDG
jgi:hypothetical protein